MAQKLKRNVEMSAHLTRETDLLTMVRGLRPWGTVTCLYVAFTGALYAERVLSACGAIPPEFAEMIAEMISAIGLWAECCSEPQAHKLLVGYKRRIEENMFPVPVAPYDTNAACHLLTAVLIMYAVTGLYGRPVMPIRQAIEFVIESLRESELAVQGKPVMMGTPPLNTFVREFMRPWATKPHPVRSPA